MKKLLLLLFAPALLNAAVLFNGADTDSNFATAPHDAAWSFDTTSAYSISFWCSPTIVNNERVIIGKIDTTGNTRGWHLVIRDNAKFGFFYYENGSVGYRHYPAGHVAVVGGVYNVVFTQTAATPFAAACQWFINGVQYSDSTNTFGTPNGANIKNLDPLTIGAQKGAKLKTTTQKYFRGSIWCPAFYNRALIQPEAQRLFRGMGSIADAASIAGCQEGWPMTYNSDGAILTTLSAFKNPSLSATCRQVKNEATLNPKGRAVPVRTILTAE